MDDGISGPSSAGPSSNTMATNKSKSQSTASMTASLPYLALRTSKSEASWSYIARTGFPLLATSSYLVEEAAQEAKALLAQYRDEWLGAVTQFNNVVSEAPPSPFTIFKKVYTQRGWHLFQLYWSEHQETRINIYHTFVRVLIDNLRGLLPLLCATETQEIKIDADQASKLSSEEILDACGVLFALKLLQSTTCLTLSDTDFEHLSGRIPIEVDLYHVFLALSSIVKASRGLGEWNNGQGIQPIDEVVYVIKEMTGEVIFHDGITISNGKSNSNSESETDSDEDDTPSRPRNVFDVLAPTEYKARPALISNHLSTKAEKDRSKRTWGELNEVNQGGASSSIPSTSGMSRTDLMRNLLRQRLQLPLKTHLEDQRSQSKNLSMNTFKHEKRGQAKDKLPIILPPDEDAEQELQDCLDQVIEQKNCYDASKKQSSIGADFAFLLPGKSDTSLVEESKMNPTLAEESIGPGRILAKAKKEVAQAIRTSMMH